MATWTTPTPIEHATHTLTAATGGQGSFGLWALFSQSFDLFTIALMAGSIVGIALIVRCLLEIRERRILPATRTGILRDLAERARLPALREEVQGDPTFLGQTLAAALGTTRDPAAPLPPGARDAAELTASEQCARLFRAIEPLNTIGNLGPLVGLAGTVWGMILAFTSLGETGGQAGASDLSLGISKALFHTLLGLLLAIPCLLAFALLRARVDRICNRGMILAAELLDTLEAAAAAPSTPAAPQAPRPASRAGREEVAASGESRP